MKKLIIFFVTLALMLAPVACFAQAASTTAEAVTTEAATEAVSEAFMFEPSNFVSNLEYMLSGMIGIFVVIGLIVIVTVVLNKIMSRRKG